MGNVISIAEHHRYNGRDADARLNQRRVGSRDAIEHLAERKDDTPGVHAQIPCDTETH